MLKTSSLRSVAIALGLSLVGCVDQVTPVGIDDIDESQNDGSNDVLKDDTLPTGRPDDSASNPQDNVCRTCTLTIVKPTPASPAAPVELNPVPVR